MLIDRILLTRFCGFSLVGGVSTLASVAILYLLNEIAGCHPYVSYVTAYVITLLFSYWANARLVYHQRFELAALIKFFLTYLSGMVIGIGLLALLRRLFDDANDTLLSCLAIPATVVWNFIFINYILGQQEQRRELVR